MALLNAQERLGRDPRAMPLIRRRPPLLVAPVLTAPSVLPAPVCHHEAWSARHTSPDVCPLSSAVRSMQPRPMAATWCCRSGLVRLCSRRERPALHPPRPPPRFALTGPYVPDSDEHAMTITRGDAKDPRPDRKPGCGNGGCRKPGASRM
jgi:hypothetical protein